jgi:hypothetical protein
MPWSALSLRYEKQCHPLWILILASKEPMIGTACDDKAVFCIVEVNIRACLKWHSLSVLLMKRTSTRPFLSLPARGPITTQETDD